LDNSVATFGNSIQNALEAIEGKTSKEINKKRERELRKWLGLPARYRSPIGPTSS
jgi:hypothetical protein